MQLKDNTAKNGGCSYSDELIARMLLHSLPFDPATSAPKAPPIWTSSTSSDASVSRGLLPASPLAVAGATTSSMTMPPAASDAWCLTLGGFEDGMLGAVELVLEACPGLTQRLADIVDRNGRKAIDQVRLDRALRGL